MLAFKHYFLSLALVDATHGLSLLLFIVSSNRHCAYVPISSILTRGGPQLGRITLNVAKVPEQMEKQRRRERLEEALRESPSSGAGLMSRMMAQVAPAP